MHRVMKFLVASTYVSFWQQCSFCIIENTIPTIPGGISYLLSFTNCPWKRTENRIEKGGKKEKKGPNRCTESHDSCSIEICFIVEVRSHNSKSYHERNDIYGRNDSNSLVRWTSSCRSIRFSTNNTNRGNWKMSLFFFVPTRVKIDAVRLKYMFNDVRTFVGLNMDCAYQ